MNKQYFIITKLIAYRNFFLVMMLLGFYSSFAQTQSGKEFLLVSDNDAYMMQHKDGYYTNGIKFDFLWNNTRTQSIHSIEIGQLMYTAQNGAYTRFEEVDRPITAFLYGKYTQENFKRNNVLQWSVTLGTIGPAALGKQIQDWFHQTIGVYHPTEWKYQLNNEAGINGNIEYSPNINLSHFAYNLIGIKPIAGATLGNTFTNANAGVAILLGKFNDNSKSIFWNANLNSRKMEYFFYAYPQIIVKAYDATVQGGMFRKDKGDYVGELNHFVFLQKFGCMVNLRKVLLNIGVNYESKESLTQRTNQWYGTISLGYKF